MRLKRYTLTRDLNLVRVHSLGAIKDKEKCSTTHSVGWTVRIPIFADHNVLDGVCGIKIPYGSQ